MTHRELERAIEAAYRDLADYAADLDWKLAKLARVRAARLEGELEELGPAPDDDEDW